jgi:hypothetical protein
MSANNHNNLVARKLSGKTLIAYKNTLRLNKQQRSILIGTLLGDASMSSNLGKAIYSVKFSQKSTLVDYINHLYTVFEPYVGTPPRPRVINSFHKIPGKSFWFRTYSHPSLKFYYDLFYLGLCGKTKLKVVPKNINQHLDSIALAYWFMDDGSHTCKKNQKSFNFSTHSFSYKDQLILVAALKKNFGIYSSLRKDKTYYRLCIKAESQNLFVDLIKPHIQPSFLYKLGL